MNIKPQTVLLTSGQAATFEATDATGQPIPVSWSLNPSIGSLSPLPPSAGAQTNSATYVAPPVVSSAQTIAIVGTTATDSASATISLTPDPIVIVPPKVDLKAGGSQQFVAIVAGVPSTSAAVPQPASPPPSPAGAGASVVSPGAGSAAGVTWILSPTSAGKLDKQTGIYEAPGSISESTAVTITAASNLFGNKATATVNLVPFPWKGRGVHWLGAYLLLVFSLVYLLIGLWPPSLPTPEAATKERLEAEKTVQQAIDAVKAAGLQVATDGAECNKQNAQESSVTSGAITDKAKTQPPDTATHTTNDTAAASAAAAKAKAKAKADCETLLRAQEEKQPVVETLKQKQNVEKQVLDPCIHTLLVHRINRDIDLLLLVLLAGALGSFLHIARSFGEFIGNERLDSNWVWWYCLAPFIGAGLALVFYAAIRGGFLALTTAANVKTSDLNPFGIVSLAALVGMFSKDATTKLGEVFKTLFKSDAPASKDALHPSSPTATTSTAPGGTALPNAASGTADKGTSTVTP